jgi:hypothetical protein
MLLVDKMLAHCLGLEEKLGIEVSPAEPKTELIQPNTEDWTGRDLGPIKKLTGGTGRKGKKKRRLRLPVS